MQSCPNCPARLMADLFDLLGAAERATEIRNAGCTWWWSIQEENNDTGQTRTREACGREWLPMFLKSYGMDLARSANVVRDDSEKIARAINGLASLIVPMKTLPPRPETANLLQTGAAE